MEVITTIEAFNAIHAEWDQLVQRADVDPIFLSHAWFRTWWEAFGEGKDLHVVLVRSEGELVAAAPMMRHRISMHGLKVTALDSIYNPHTPRYDFIVACDQGGEVYRLIWNALANNEACDMVRLSQVPTASRTIPAIREFAEKEGWLTGFWKPSPSPYIRLGCDYDEFFARLKGGYRYNLRQRHKRLSKIGHVDVEAVTGEHNVREALCDGLRIEAAAWKGDQGTAILSDPAVTEFYIRLAERQAKAGQLKLSFLRVGGKRISFNYLLRSGRTLYGVKIGYDPEYHSYSPGNMHLNMILQEACGEGIEEYDFLGVQDEWKMDWTKETHEHDWLFLYRRRLRPVLLRCLKFTVVPRIRPALRVLRTLPGFPA